MSFAASSRPACMLVLLASGPGGGCSGTGSDVAEPRLADGTAVVSVEIRGFRSDQGSALVGLYTSEAGFPDDGGAARDRIEVAIANGVAQATFENVPATRVAIAVLHDEDGDKRMKTGLFGQPKEGYGVSRDAPARFGPPSFGDAALEVAEGEHLQTTIKVRY